MPAVTSTSRVTSHTTGRAKPAFTITHPSKGVSNISIDFRAAAALAKGRPEFKVGSTQYGDIYLTRIDLGTDFVLTDKKLPPYEAVIRPRSDIPDDMYIQRDTGTSSWNKPSANDSGDSLLRKGRDTIKFEKGYDTNKIVETVHVSLDAVNDYERKPPKAASLASKPYREAWVKNWNRHDTYFTFDKGIADKSLVRGTVAELKKLPGGPTIIKAIEEGGGKVEDFVKRGTVKIAKDAKTGSFGVIVYTEGEIEHSLVVTDKAGKLLGQWRVDSDGRKSWIEE